MAIELQILRAGDGQYYPKQGETVAVHYTVSLSNGKEVDNTYKRGQPFRFEGIERAGGEGVGRGGQAAQRGGEGVVRLPPLRIRGKGNDLIPPRSDLHVTLELVSITKED